MTDVSLLILSSRLTGRKEALSGRNRRSQSSLCESKNMRVALARDIAGGFAVDQRALLSLMRPEGALSSALLSQRRASRVRRKANSVGDRSEASVIQPWPANAGSSQKRAVADNARRRATGRCGRNSTRRGTILCVCF